MEIDLNAKLSATLDTMAEQQKQLDQTMRRIQEALTHAPIDYPIHGSITFPATTTTGVVGLGGPSIGRLWQVRRLAMRGTTGAKVFVYVNAAKPTTNTAIIGMADYHTGMPWATFYSTHQLVLNGNEKLWLYFTGATAGHTVQITGRVEDYDFAAYRGVTQL